MSREQGGAAETGGAPCAKPGLSQLQSAPLTGADELDDPLAHPPLRQTALQDSADGRAQRAEALLARADFAGAERLLRKACEAFSDHARLWALLATASWSRGQKRAALIAIDRALRLAPSASFATHKGWMLLKSGNLAQAEAVLREAIARFSDGGTAQKVLTQVYKASERWTAGAAAAALACAADAADFDMRESWAGCLLGAERPGEAMSVIDEGLKLFDDAGAKFQLLMRKAEAHKQLRNSDQAIVALTEAVALQPDDEMALQKLCDMMSMLPEHDAEAARCRARLRRLQARGLPDRLADGLAAIWERTEDIPLDEAALEWAWEVADKSSWDKTEWRRAAAWGKEADVLLWRWLQTAPRASLRQLDELIDKPDLSALFAASVERGTCFVICAHVGPLAAIVNLIATSNRPLRWIGSFDRERPHDENFIPVTANSLEPARSVLRAMKDGATIFNVADAAEGLDPLALEFLGRRIELPRQVPKLIQKQNSPSFWCCALWRNGRITIKLEPLPDPAEGERRDAWTRRWFAAYLEKVEAAMRGPPENLGLYAGIWSNVNRTALEERRARRQSRGRTRR